MNTEEKAKAFDEALERARKMLNMILDNELLGFPDQIREIFPQLCESDDERIRKWIIDEIKATHDYDSPTSRKCVNDALAYLEKQKELFKSGRGLYYYDGEKTVYMGYPATEENSYDFAMNQQEEKQKVNTEGDFGRGYDCGYQAGYSVAMNEMKPKVATATLDSEKQKEHTSAEPELKIPDWVHGSWDDEYMINTVIGRYSLHAEVAKKRGDTHDYNLSKSMENWLRNVVKPLILEKQQEQKLNPDKEKLIRHCIGLILTDATDERFKDYGLTLKDCLTWLDEQKEQKPRKFKLGDKVHWHDDTNVIIITGFRDDAYLTDSAYGPILFCDEDNWERIEQNPTEQSEDERMEHQSAESHHSNDASEYDKEQKPVHTAKERWKEMRLEVYAQASGNRHEPNCSDDSTKMFSLCDIDEIFEKIDSFIIEPESVKIDEYEIIKKHITYDALSSEVNKRLKECGWYVIDEKPTEWSEDYREEDIQTRFAFYTYKDDPSVLYLSNVFVEKPSRNHGFGTRILRAAEKVAETIGATTISLKVKQDSPANTWYRKNGYGYVAFEDGYDWLEKNLEYMKPVKSAEWSDDIIRKAVKEVGLTQHQIDWLKTNVFSPKQEWSEEDKTMLKVVTSDVARMMHRCGVGTDEAIIRSKAIRWLEALCPNQKSEWSEEDEKMRIKVLEALSAYADHVQYTGFCANSEVIRGELMGWLKSLPLKLKKENEDVAKLCSNEWSEEDEKYLNRLINFLVDVFGEDSDTVKWLKSLRPSWKPSDEQMDALRASNSYWQGTTNEVPRINLLESLYNDLKKLM